MTNLPDPPKGKAEADDEAFNRASERQGERERVQRRSGAISIALVVLAVVGVVYWYAGRGTDAPIHTSIAPTVPTTTYTDAQEQGFADGLRDVVADIVTTQSPSVGVPMAQAAVNRITGLGCRAAYGVQFSQRNAIPETMKSEIETGRAGILKQGGSFAEPVIRRMTQQDSPYKFVVVVAAVIC